MYLSYTSICTLYTGGRYGSRRVGTGRQRPGRRYGGVRAAGAHPGATIAGGDGWRGERDGSGYPIDRADVLSMQLLPQEHQPTGVPHDVLLPEDLRRVRLLDSRGGLLWMQPLRPSSFSP